ncbi:MAG TPA: trypsin-like peptidase domain-containing protein [Gaiellaceae bacterium]|nr:trypsin-like peptidase domain-containing protein [Gaiellaceae bacterium]
MTPRTRSLAVVAALAAALVVGVGAGALAFAVIGNDSGKTVVREVTVSGSQPTAAGALTVGQVYDKTYRSVVEITVDTTTGSAFGQQQQQAQGSGFVYDENGDIVTNDHVVDGADSISVRFWNGATYKAKLVGSDPSTDLAVIKVSAPASLLQPLQLADSSKVAVGDPVVAIGSPFGLEGTVTSGIVSALHRAMEAPNNFTINDSIQTDAAINHGNSGGPLLNDLGQVVGINAQIDSESGGSDGVGFAIPSDTVRAIVSQLVQSGKVEHAYLGVQIVAIPSDVARQLGLPAGVEVTKVVSGTPSDHAGLQAATGQKLVDGQQYPTGGDVIVGFDGKTVTSAAQLQTLVDSKRPGDKVTVTYVRSGKTKSVTVTLDTRPS